jgi:hypothetical protein
MLMPGSPLEGRARELKEKHDAVVAAKSALARAMADLDTARADQEGASGD